MMKKCSGCGALLQVHDSTKEGYTKDIKKDICERCFRIKNYGEYVFFDKKNSEFIDILKEINNTSSLVVLVIDVFNIPKELEAILKNMNNNILLVMTKRDILSYKINDEKLLNYMDRFGINFIDKIIVSSIKNYNFDLLYQKIIQYKNSDDVYIVGYTNAGKSTLINKLIYNYSDLNKEITTSILPSTTISTIKIPLDNNLTLIDTPGLLEENNIMNIVDSKILKKIIPKKEIKPITYQVKAKQFIWVEDFLMIESLSNNLTLYFSNQLKIERIFKEKKHSLKENIIRVKQNQDIVISGLGFIKVFKDEVVKIYTLENVNVYVRESLI